MLDMIVDEPLVLDEQLVQHMIVDELVLHMIMVVEEMCRIVVVKQLLKNADYIVVDCTEVNDCCSRKHGPHVALDRHTADQSLTHAYPLLI
ncbi:hypothetical protein Tco_0732864 [Tanacetum coccineum]